LVSSMLHKSLMITTPCLAVNHSISKTKTLLHNFDFSYVWKPTSKDRKTKKFYYHSHVTKFMLASLFSSLYIALCFSNFQKQFLKTNHQLFLFSLSLNIESALVLILLVYSLVSFTIQLHYYVIVHFLYRTLSNFTDQVSFAVWWKYHLNF
jgi:hypothetical protein